MRNFGSVAVAVAVTMGVAATPALAGGGARPQAHGAQIHQPRIHQPSQHSHSAREPAQQDAGGVRGQALVRARGSRPDPSPDPNYQNPYRPMFSPDAVNPGEQHPYFRTPHAGFGYPTGKSGVYQGNGIYVIPR